MTVTAEDLERATSTVVDALRPAAGRDRAAVHRGGVAVGDRPHDLPGRERVGPGWRWRGAPPGE